MGFELMVWQQGVVFTAPGSGKALSLENLSIVCEL